MISIIGVIIKIFVLAIVVIGFVSNNIKVVPQANAYVVERLGTYKETWGVGLHFKVPFIDKIAKKVNLKEQVADFAPQPVITKDNVTMQIDTVIYYQISDPKLYIYGIENPLMAIENLTATTLRNIIGKLNLDDTLTSRDIINTEMRAILDEVTDPWGIKVNSVEVKNIIPPQEIRIAMEKEMKAEREKREKILRAEGEKQSAILAAEGKKESSILEATAEQKVAILKAEAKKQYSIKTAEGEAEAIKIVQEATAEGLRQIKDVKPDNQLIALKSLETLAEVADGKATKIIIPSNIQDLAALTASLSEINKEIK